ncbi:MAG: TonB-dependent receptor [Acidobacteriota bacterium]|nr:TonB-dependent receptor [Acidobacteriota bacterium]
MSDYALAQGTSSRVTGTVTDNSGAVVPDATVTLLNEGTAQSLTAQTSEDGNYSFDLIPVGTYTITVEKAGFKRLVSTNNNVNVNLPTTLNVALEIGDVSATVTVENTAEVVQTSTSGNVGTTIEQRTVESLPIVGLRGRNPLDLINFQPGVVVGANIGGGVHVNGSRDRAFNFTLDGIDINESSAGGSNFTPIRPNPDAIQEFQILTSNFTAEQGRSSGAQVSLITRSGTNRLSGNIFEYYQTPDFNANEYENNLNSIPRRQFLQHIFGGSLGGPLVIPGFGEGTPPLHVLKDRAFFFVNLQLLRANETRLAQRTVYTDLARQGIYRYVVGGRNAAAGTSTSTAFPTGASVNADGSPRYPNCVGNPPTNAPCIQAYNVRTQSPITIDPFIGSLLSSIPSPNDFSRGDGLNTAGFNFVAPQIENQYDFVSKFDFKLNDNNQFYLRYSQGQQDTLGDRVNGGQPAFPGFPNLVDTLRNPKNAAFNYRASPSAKLTNEFVFGINLFSFSFATAQPDPNIPFVLNNVTDPNTNFAYNARTVRTFQFVDNLTYDFSPHIIKTGINFRFGKQFDDRSSAGGGIEGSVGFGAGSSSFTGFNLPSAGSTSINSVDLSRLQSTVNDLIGRIGSINQGFVVDPSNPSRFAPAGTRFNFTAYYPEYDFYVQDTWRARQNLTFDIGLRYEIKLNPSSKDLPILRPNQPFTTGSTPTNTLRFVEGDLFKDDFNNLSPSLGFAYDPFKSGKTSIRANYRLSYDRFPSQVFANSIYQSTPGNTFASTISGVGTQNLLIRNGFPNLTPTLTPDALRQTPAFSPSGITLVDPDLQFPENHQWFVGFQRELWAKNVLEINYIGRRGTHLFGGYDANQVNILASDPRCPENFLQAFNALRASTTANSCLINLLFTGSGTNNAGTATFRSIPAISSTLSNTQTGGSVATAAVVVSQRSPGNNQQLIATTINNPFFFQSLPQFSGNVNVLDSNDVSRYNGLEFIIKRRITNGIGYQLAYTFSKSMDTRSFDPTFTTVSRGTAQSASSTPFDINNRRLNYALSDFDRRHALQAYYVIDLPFGRGRKFGSDTPRVVDFFVGGWQIAGTFNLASGRPFTVYSGLNTFSNVVSSTANCDNCPRDLGGLIQRNGTNFFFTEEAASRFSLPAPGELGNTGRNYFIGPRQFQTNVSLAKKFKFTERYSFDLRVDALNVTNTPNFGFPTTTLTSSAFGQIRDNVTTLARRLQFSGKLNF